VAGSDVLAETRSQAVPGLSDGVLMSDVVRLRSFSPSSSALRHGRSAAASCRSTSVPDAAFVHYQGDGVQHQHPVEQLAGGEGLAVRSNKSPEYSVLYPRAPVTFWNTVHCLPLFSSMVSDKVMPTQSSLAIGLQEAWANLLPNLSAATRVAPRPGPSYIGCPKNRISAVIDSVSYRGLF